MSLACGVGAPSCWKMNTSAVDRWLLHQHGSTGSPRCSENEVGTVEF